MEASTSLWPESRESAEVAKIKSENEQHMSRAPLPLIWVEFSDLQTRVILYGGDFEVARHCRRRVVADESDAGSTPRCLVHGYSMKSLST